MLIFYMNCAVMSYVGKKLSACVTHRQVLVATAVFLQYAEVYDADSLIAENGCSFIQNNVSTCNKRAVRFDTQNRCAYCRNTAVAKTRMCQCNTRT